MFLIGLLQKKKKMIRRCDDAVYSNDNIVFSNEDCNNVTFSSVDMDILSVDLNNVNLNDVNFDEDDPETIIHVRFIA